jgi:hypothetical protein
MKQIFLTDQEQTFLKLLCESHTVALDVFGHCEALNIVDNDKTEQQMADAFVSLKRKLETK